MIPVSEPLVGKDEVELACEAVKTGWISSAGPNIEHFETLVASYCNRRFGVAVNNGTSALILAVRALNLPAGGEVIIPSHTIISCALACVYNNLVPVFVDAEYDTWNMDVNLLEERVTERTVAVMPVHIFGFPINMAFVMAFAEKYGLKVIEDFAEAIGSEFGGRRCGSFGDVSCVSFYANKTITTGEGGMCLTDDENLYEHLKALRNLAFLPSERFRHEELGFNFRMTNVQAAIGVGQMRRIEYFVNRRIEIARTYTELLTPLAEAGKLKLPPPSTEKAKNTFWMYAVTVEDKNLDGRKLGRALDRLGIQTRPFFFPLHRQPAFQQYPWFKEQTLPISEDIYRKGLYLPSGMGLSESEIMIVVDALKAVLG